MDLRECVCMWHRGMSYLETASVLSCKYLLKLKWVSLSPPPLSFALSLFLSPSFCYVCGELWYVSDMWLGRKASKWDFTLKSSKLSFTSTVNDQCSFSKNRWHLSFSRWTDFWNEKGNMSCCALHNVNASCVGRHLRWPRELNALKLQKTRANRKSTSKSRKHLHQFDNSVFQFKAI